MTHKYPGPSSETWSNTKESVLLITGGSGDGNSSSEVYPSNSSCSPPPLPAEREFHTTFLTSEPNPVIATCGGMEAGVFTASCLVLDKSDQSWDESRMGDLTMPRGFSGVATLNSVGVFIIGGKPRKYDSSEFLPAGSMTWQKGPLLPFRMENPCIVTITATSFLAISNYHIHEFDAAIAGPTSIEGWRDWRKWPQWPQLKGKSKRWSGCAKLGQKIIIAGVTSFGPSTEVLDLDSREVLPHIIEVRPGGEMATPRNFFHLATIREGGLEKVFALGGKLSSSLDTVEEWVEESSTWREADSFLEERRVHFGVVSVPPELICEA